MCGIFGIASHSRPQNERDIICRTGTERLAHRGPDGSGHWSAPGVSLGHRRLSIIDIVGGTQPMPSARAPLTIVFNGEIVNHAALRKDLESKGVRFVTDHSDTEVILALYERFGADCLKHLRGMFAFAIWDGRDDSLFLARDHMGIKPLYYFEGNSELAFSSEIHALHDSGLVPFQANHKTFNEFLIFGVIAGRATVHDKIFELPAGHAALFKNGSLKVQRYWYPASGEFRGDLSLDDATDQLDSLICETMREWTISDVPVGALVSGGLDSTLVSYLSARDLDRLDMFTVFFPDHSAEVDERHLAVLAAKAAQREHIEVPFYDNYIPGNLERLVAHFDEPLQDTNSLTFMGLSEYIQQNSNVKAVITGEGSDEMFGGYQRHRIIADEFEKTGDPSVLMYAMNKVALPRLELFAETTAFDNPERLAIVENLISQDAVGKGLELDQICFLPGYLQRVDQIGMMFGLEMRPPLLDHRLVRFANALPKRLRMQQEPNGHHWHKYLVRKVAERYMPDKIVWNREKYQFMIPAARMLYDGPLRTMFLDLFTPNCELSSYYDITGIHKLLNMHQPVTEGGDDHSNTLGRLLSMEIWLRARKANPGGRLLN